MFVGRPPKRHHAPPGDHLEEAFLVRRPHVATVDAHRDRTVGRVLFFLLPLLTVEQVELTFLSQFFLYSLGRYLEVMADRLVVGLRRQHLLQ